MRLVPLLLLLAALPGRAEIYRCPGPEGALRFTDDPADCPKAIRQPLGELQSAGSAVSEPLEAPAADGYYEGDLAEIFPPERSVAGLWEIVGEAPSDPSRDPELWGAGVRAVGARHYTRAAGPVSQVCSLEIWRFESVGRAAHSERRAVIPGWRFLRRGNLLISARAVTLEREVGSRPGIFPDCDRLVERAGERAASLLR